MTQSEDTHPLSEDAHPLTGPATPPDAAVESTPGECPVVRLPDGTWAVRGHADVRHVAQTPEIFSSAARSHLHVPNGMDGAEHRRFRAVIDEHLDDSRILPLAPMITQVAEHAVAELVARTRAADILHEFGRLVAVRVQSRWLGWSADLEDELLGWIDDNFAATRSGDPSRNAAVAEHFDRIVHGILSERRARRAAGQALPDDPTTALLDQHVEDPEAPGGSRLLTHPELVSTLRNWTAGDLGSIASSIGVVVHHVAADPQLQEHLRILSHREADHLEELDAAVDEMLRIDNPFPFNKRVTVRRTQLAGYSLPTQTPLVINWTAANRDERVFGDPDAYRPAQNRAANIVYGAGPHICPGRVLSTLQIRGALAALLRATTSITLDPDRTPVREAFPSRGFETVPVLLQA
ncbi:cytochrome P450 [Ornithinimicrobium cryptoxanthini]|uniref:Cytochrome P450 n=1 Tax=Ornithinimicrobium cryptoxanthini TaxID=2934161 RepID=A0ABY4YJJ5_9MICO|nr:cytochrome P450 [Ornithinimicrobium cryptoxanthini]USQ76963.1 cytochrome P450 [Ornithinimicrobium cryptoxanthini]